MAKTTLPTNYVDDVLNGAMDGKRRYREIPNADGTISLEDATTYDQIGSNFGASQLNLMNDNINQSFDSNKMLKTMDEVNAVTEEGYGVDALVVKQVNDSLGGVQFGIDGEGNRCYLGADGSLIPFSSGSAEVVMFFQCLVDRGTLLPNFSTDTIYTVAEKGTYSIVTMINSYVNSGYSVYHNSNIVASVTYSINGGKTAISYNQVNIECEVGDTISIGDIYAPSDSYNMLIHALVLH